MKWHFSVYRYNSEVDTTPHMQDYELELSKNENLMVLDALILLKEQDPTLTFRRASREGSCGSDGMNINGMNGLACITPLSLFMTQSVVLKPLPGLPVIRDLVVDMTLFYDNYAKVKPYLIADAGPSSVNENLQSPQDRQRLDGWYECTLCACCSSACLSYWRHPDTFIGPAGLLFIYRWLVDSRDTGMDERLSMLDDAFRVFRCHNMMNCIRVCPEGLNPVKAIGRMKQMLVKRSV